MTADPTPTPEQPHEHHWRFDGDDPRLVCKCGEYRDALTGEPIEAQARPEQDEAVRRAADTLRAWADTHGMLRDEGGVPTAAKIVLRALATADVDEEAGNG